MLALADVAVTVSNTEESARWWREVVGFATHTIGQPGGHAVMVAPPGERFVLHLCEGFEPVEPGNTGVAFVTDELESLVARWETAGVRFVEHDRVSHGGGSAKFADPDGNVFWLLGAPRGFIREQMDKRATTPTAKPRSRARRTTGSQSKR